MAKKNKIIVPELYTQFEGWFDFKYTYDKLSLFLKNRYEETKEPVVFIEIGVYLGRSIAYISESLTLMGIPYVCYGIDNISLQNRGLLQNIETIKEYGLNVVLLEGKSEDILPTFEGNHVDAIFIDGDHSYCGACTDITLASEIISSGGVVAGHDYGHPEIPSVAEAINDWAVNNNKEITLLPNDTSITTNFCFWFQC